MSLILKFWHQSQVLTSISSSEFNFFSSKVKLSSYDINISSSQVPMSSYQVLMSSCQVPKNMYLFLIQTKVLILSSENSSVDFKFNYRIVWKRITRQYSTVHIAQYWYSTGCSVLMISNKNNSIILIS